MTHRIHFRTENKIFSALFLCVLAACAGLPPATVRNCERLTTGPGPEDFAVDRSTGTARILVSSHDRRAWSRGEIFVVDPAGSRTGAVLPREGEPPELFFAPHGLDVATLGGTTYLYVISHGKHKETGEQQVLIYRVLPAALRFVMAIESPLFTSPNDLAIDPAGGFYLSNDAQTRGSFTEMLFALKRSTVVYCPFQPGRAGAASAPDGEKTAGTGDGRTSRSNVPCIVAAQGLAMANGVAVQGSAVFVSTTRGNTLTRFVRMPDGRLAQGRILFSAASLDNLFFAQLSPGNDTRRTEVLVASHPAGIAFLRHSGNASVPSPSVIYAVDTETGASRALYANDGIEISAASGAFELDGQLYISQVFEPHLLRCSLGSPGAASGARQ